MTVRTHLCKLPLFAGTKDSCDFHYRLYLCNDPTIFATETIKTFVQFKSVQSLPFFWAFAIPYIVYMLGLIIGTVYDVKEFRGPAFLAIFGIIQTLQVVCTLITQPGAIRQMWVLWDIIRIVFLIWTFVLETILGGNHESATLVFMCLNWISWFCVLKYLRRWGSVRVYIKLVLGSLYAMINFLLIFIVIVIAFASSQHLKAINTK